MNVMFYPNHPSASRPVVHGSEVPVLQPTEILEDAYTNRGAGIVTGYGLDGPGIESR
jgi:hypothetical protein